LGAPQLAALLVAMLRLGEVLVARRNTRRLLAQGAVEHGSGHYPLIVALHLAWLWTIASLPAESPLYPLPLAFFALLQPIRLWILLSLGRRWTTRVIVLPRAPLVRRGPYRWLRHPNYLIVALEIPLLPLAFGAWPIAAVLGLSNLALLAWRIGVEARALRAVGGAPPAGWPAS
jgi:methyltransferase